MREEIREGGAESSEGNAVQKRLNLKPVQTQTQTQTKTQTQTQPQPQTQTHTRTYPQFVSVESKDV